VTKLETDMTATEGAVIIVAILIVFWILFS
jgi:hypothetical protein